MEIKEIALDEFDSVFPSNLNPIIFSTARFNQLNRSKAEDVKALAMVDDDGSVLIGQIFGLRGRMWRAPFSAPFSTAAGAEISKQLLTEFYSLSADFLGSPLRLVLPPPFYPSSITPEVGAQVDDFNYHYPLSRYRNYESHLSRPGRKNHRNSLKHPFDFFKTDDIGRAYGIIAQNRKAMGYPLAMSLEQVEATSAIIPADFFVMAIDGTDCAAAVVFKVAPSIMQVIYWGDIPEFRVARPMNRLAWELFGWYAANRPDIDIIDIGPSSTDGVKNEGLASFKLSIGCVETLRPTITIE